MYSQLKLGNFDGLHYLVHIHYTSSISIKGFSVLVFLRHWIILPGIAPIYVRLKRKTKQKRKKHCLCSSPNCYSRTIQPNINVRAVVNFAHAAQGKSITIMKTEPHTPRWSQNFQRPWRAFGYARGLIIRRIFLSLNSQIKIEILLTVNHTILLMLVLRI